MPTGEPRKIGHEPAPRIRQKGLAGPRIGVEKCLADLLANLKVLRPDRRPQPGQEAL